MKNEEVDCKNCIYNRKGLTKVVTAYIIEDYCGLTNTDEFCYGEFYKEGDD